MQFTRLNNYDSVLGASYERVRGLSVINID